MANLDSSPPTITSGLICTTDTVSRNISKLSGSDGKFSKRVRDLSDITVIMTKPVGMIIWTKSKIQLRIVCNIRFLNKAIACDLNKLTPVKRYTSSV